MKPLPSDLQAYADQCVAALRLHDWTITFAMRKKPGNKASNMGATWLSPRYLSARIEIRRDLVDAQARDTVLHELLHVVLGDVRQAQSRLLDLVAPAQVEHAAAIYTDAEEQTIERLIRVFAPFISIPAPDGDPQEDHDVSTLAD